jgi:hypothetical protein
VIEQILSTLILERDKLTRAIEALQGPTTRKTRTPRKISNSDYDDPTMPDWVKPAAMRQPTTTRPRKKRTFTAAQRKATGARMKAYWAAKRKAKAT